MGMWGSYEVLKQERVMDEQNAMASVRQTLEQDLGEDHTQGYTERERPGCKVRGSRGHGRSAC